MCEHVKTLSGRRNLLKAGLLWSTAHFLAIALPFFSGCGNTTTGAQTPPPGDSETVSDLLSESKPEEKKEPGDKTLVIYFSHSGNTRVIAGYVHSLVGGELVELKTVDPYPQDYNRCVDQARKELDADFRPKLKTTFENLDDFETVYLGYPNWWGTAPMAVATMFDTCDFSGKTIIPFCTHEGSGLGQSTRDIAKWGSKSTIMNGLAVRGRSVDNSRPDVEKWLQRLGKISKTK